MSKKWPYDQIREALTLAELNGSARVETETVRDAELLRYAMYNFRSTTSIGQGLRITLDGSSVVIERTVVPEVTIVE